MNRLGSGERDWRHEVKPRPRGPSERERASQSRISNPQTPRAFNAAGLANALPTGSRRYGRLEVCATALLAPLLLAAASALAQTPSADDIADKSQQAFHYAGQDRAAPAAIAGGGPKGAGSSPERGKGAFGIHPDSPRHFVYRGRPFFFVGKSAFALIDADWKAFIDEAHKDGFTVLRVWLCCPALTKKHGRDHFQRNQAAGDVWPFGGAPGQPDFTRFNEDYFNRLDALLAYMEAKGMVAELTLFTGGDVWPGGVAAWDEVQQRYVRFVLDRYRGRPNLYYEIANEYYSAEQQAFVEKVGEFIWARDQAHLVTASAGDLPRFADKPWYRLHNFHPSRGRYWWTRVYDEVLLPARHARLPLVNDEPMGSRAADDNEEGYPGRDADAAHHRMNFWVTALGGGHVTFHSHKGINALSGHSPGQEFVRPFRRFFEKTRFWELEPTPERVRAGRAFVVRSSAELAAYLPGGDVTLDLRGFAGALTARWFDPREGRFGEGFTIEGGGPREFRPTERKDWGLHLARQEQ
ncbi:MAG: DUF4038 domain-containing protein [Chloroflexi bacterium]|nr:DUF4038 domain-containing protein [Chloroflexota bacterium]